MYSSQLNSVQFGGLDFFSGAMDFDDLAFLSYVMCMEEANAGLSATMKKIRDASEQKKAILEDIDLLKEALDKAKGNESILVYGSLSDPEKPPVFDRGEIHEGPEAGDVDNIPDEPHQTCTKTEVKTRIEQLQAQLEELNSDSSVLMIDLQRLLNKRNEASTLVSNIISGSHQTAMSIISKFGS